jgi:hypothetical protein
MVFQETVEIFTPVEESSDESPAVSWAAIAAGAVAAAALTLVLLAFGAGMGFSAVSPWVILAYRPAHSKLAPVSI